MMTLKISLGIFFARIVVRSWQLIVIYATIGINIFSTTAAFFYALFRCGPNLNAYVTNQIVNNCTPRHLDRFMAYQQASFTTLTDLIFLALPVFILWNANMSRRSKVSVGLILCLAALGCICSILRFRYVDGLTRTDDFFWHAVNIAIWSTIECGASIIAGCLATMRPLMKLLIARTGSHISRTLGHSHSHSHSTTPAPSNPNPHSTHSHSTHSASVSSKSKSASDQTSTLPPTFLECLARPGEEVIALGEYRTESTERILLGRNDDAVLEFPWPVKGEERRVKRQTVHAQWTLRKGVAGDGRMASVYDGMGDAV
jgi:hypothetical protein